MRLAPTRGKTNQRERRERDAELRGVHQTAVPNRRLSRDDACQAPHRCVAIRVPNRVRLRNFGVVGVFAGITACYLFVIVAIGVFGPKTTGRRLDEIAH